MGERVARDGRKVGRQPAGALGGLEGLRRNPRAAGGAGAFGADRSVRGVPDDGIGIVIILAGGAAEIGVELARTELRCGD